MIYLEIVVLVVLFSAVFFLLERLYKPLAPLLGAFISAMLLAMVLLPGGLDACLPLVHPLGIALGAVTNTLGYNGSVQWSAGGRGRDCVIFGSLGYATMVYAAVLTRCFGIFDRRSRR